MIRFILAALMVCTAVSRAADEKGQLDFSPSLFTVMAAINSAGYDAETQSPNNDPLRNRIRAEVAATQAPVIAELRKFYADHKLQNETAELGRYISFALSVDGPPDFVYKYREAELPPDIRALEGFGPLVARFYREARIESLWKSAQPDFERTLERYHGPVSQAVLEANAYLRNPTAGYLGRTFQIYLDLLAAPNQVQSRSYGNDYFVVVTPSAQPRVADIRHGYLHYLLDPLATKYSALILKNNSLVDYAQGAPALDPAYKNDFLLLATESLIKAIEARLPGHTETVDEALREGYILTPFFAEQLNLYDKQIDAMRLFFPEMIQRIDLKREVARLDKVQFDEHPRSRVAQAPIVERPVEPVKSAAAKTADEGDRLYASKDYDRAKQTYLRALEQAGEKSDHARAYYGLARIAVLQKDPETGEKLFQKVLDSMPDPWVKAWTHVYLGRLSDAAGEREDATRHYRAALAVDGASAAARQAAERGVHEAFTKQN